MNKDQIEKNKLSKSSHSNAAPSLSTKPLSCLCSSKSFYSSSFPSSFAHAQLRKKKFPLKRQTRGDDSQWAKGRYYRQSGRNQSVRFNLTQIVASDSVRHTQTSSCFYVRARTRSNRLMT
jgi:hypothetical protein